MPRRDPTEMPHADKFSDGLSGSAQVENVADFDWRELDRKTRRSGAEPRWRRSPSTRRPCAAAAATRNTTSSHHGGRASSQTKITAHAGARWVIASTPAAQANDTTGALSVRRSRH